MCGINVIIDFENSSSESNLKDLMQMQRLTRHRGPDFSGVFHYSNVYLGHNRLSIIDLTSKSNQPFESDNHVIVFNGEIYNYVEIKRDLESKGISFNTQGDTEVLLKAFVYYGLSFLSKLDGMFAFVILDKANNRLIFARDRFGIKPLYYYREGARLFLSSEIKAIHPFITVRKENSSEIDNFLLFGKSDSSKFCFLQGVLKVEPRQFGTVSLEDESHGINFSYYSVKSKEIRTFEEELLNSVRSHLVTDVDVAYTLSGGLDSSSLLFGSVCGTNSMANFSSFTFKSKDFHSSDSIYVEKISKVLNLSANYVFTDTSDESGFYDELSNLVWQMDEPFGGISIYYQNKVMQAIAKKKYKVVISGQGADEFLFGYSKYYTAIIIDVFRKNNFFRSLKIIWNITRNNDSISIMQFLSSITFLFMPNLVLHLKLKKVRKFINIKLPKSNYFDEFRNASFRDLNELRNFEILSNMQALLRFEDRNSMAHSVESRVPFVSNRVFDCICEMDTEQLCANGFLKAPLRELSFLPDFIKTRRDKLGFDVNKGGARLPVRKMMEDIKSSNILKSRLLEVPLDKCPEDLFFRLWCVAKWETYFLNI